MVQIISNFCSSPDYIKRSIGVRNGLSDVLEQRSRNCMESDCDVAFRYAHLWWISIGEYNCNSFRRTSARLLLVRWADLLVTSQPRLALSRWSKCSSGKSTSCSKQKWTRCLSVETWKYVQPGGGAWMLSPEDLPLVLRKHEPTHCLCRACWYFDTKEKPG